MDSACEGNPQEERGYIQSGDDGSEEDVEEEVWRKKKSQKVESEVDKGGAIRNARSKPTVTDVRRIQMSERLMPEGIPQEDTDTDSEDEETGAYTHYGGRLSGRGMAYDDPEVAQAMIKTFQGFPEILHAYTSGRVSNPPGQYDGLQRFSSRDAGASVIDYGGSLPGITHSENGSLMAHDASFPHEFHII